MCNVFKPERCHHCSTCNRCVLNMDHHCPWVSNCIGFWNRKYFLLMLFYLQILIVFYLASMCSASVCSVMHIIEQINNVITIWNIVKDAITLVLYIFMAFACVMMVIFLKYHIRLVVYNITTLENLDTKGVFVKSKYDVGIKENWKQVFGPNSKLWWVPIGSYGGKPMGNGVSWLQTDNNGCTVIMDYQPDDRINRLHTDSTCQPLKQDSINTHPVVEDRADLKIPLQQYDNLQSNIKVQSHKNPRHITIENDDVNVEPE